MSHALIDENVINDTFLTSRTISPNENTVQRTKSLNVSSLDLRDLLLIDGEDSHERLYGENGNVETLDNVMSLFFNSLPVWASGAACDAKTSHYFHDYDDNSRTFIYETEAKKLCASCKVQELCLKTSLETGDVYSIWGGLTPLERAKKYPKAFNASINHHVRNVTFSKSSGRHIKRRPYRHKNTSIKTHETSHPTTATLDSSFFTSGIQLTLFPLELDSAMIEKSTIYGLGDRFDFPARFKQTLRFPRNSTLKTGQSSDK